MWFIVLISRLKFFAGVLFSQFADVPLLIFWTKNGILTNLRVEGVENIPMQAPLFAAVGIGSAGAEVKVNFVGRSGGTPFQFKDLDKAVDGWLGIRKRETAAIRTSMASGSSACSSIETSISDAASVKDRVLMPVDDRLWRFRCVGNAIGLCLLHGGEQYELRLPVYFSRHVYKFLLGRRIAFSDYAYYHPDGHASLLKMTETASKILAGESVTELLDGSSRSVGPDEDYWMLEWDDSVAIPGGNQPVTARNAHAYVQRKAQVKNTYPKLQSVPLAYRVTFVLCCIARHGWVCNVGARGNSRRSA
eukprot:SAG31_NODE_4645_length_3075_cov_147.262433_5_plen_305_part_00